MHCRDLKICLGGAERSRSGRDGSLNFAERSEIRTRIPRRWNEAAPIHSWLAADLSNA